MTVAQELNIQYQEVNSLTAYSRNARTHSKRQIQQIAHSIKEFGFTSPILINRDQMIIAGHGRVQAAKKLGMNRVPTICLETCQRIRSEPMSLRITNSPKMLAGMKRSSRSNCNISSLSKTASISRSPVFRSRRSICCSITTRLVKSKSLSTPTMAPR